MCSFKIQILQLKANVPPRPLLQKIDTRQVFAISQWVSWARYIPRVGILADDGGPAPDWAVFK